MARTTRHAGWLIAALAALPGFPAACALAAEPRPTGPVSVVAQSTKATAATGRRPIAERIAASNLPLRANAPPDCAQENQEPISPGDVPAPLADPDSIAAEPPLPEPDDLAVLPEKEPTAEAQPAANETAAEDRTVEKAVVAASSAEPASRSKPSDAVRSRLLSRIKGAFAVRPRTTARTEAVAEIDAASPASAASAEPQPLAVDATAATPASESAAPARLEFDVRESRSLVGEGEQIVMRIAVRNVGGATAEQVTTTLFFADGIEPVQAIGHAAEVFPGEVRFATVPELSPGSSVDLLVTAVGTRPGSVAYRGELACGQLAGMIAREGAVTVQPRRPPVP